jgi:hypothetical protein
MCHKPLINVFVSCPQRVLCFRIDDAIDHMKTLENIFMILDEAIFEVGKENVVQVVTDNITNYVCAEMLTMEKYKKNYWTPYAAHCLDLW